MTGLEIAIACVERKLRDLDIERERLVAQRQSLRRQLAAEQPEDRKQA
jgi:hypothetical protein